MTPVEQCLAEVVASLLSLSEMADGAGHDALHSAVFASVLTLIDGARESGVKVDTDALGFMAGFVDG